MNEPTIVVAHVDTGDRTPSGAVAVTTPLDLIRTLDKGAAIGTVMLYDAFARDRAVVSFVRENYPWLHVIVMDRTERASAPQLAWA